MVDNNTLYYCPGHLSFAPHVILNEIAKPFTLVKVSIKDGDTKSEGFKRINPKGKVPILVSGENILTESSAILLYLALTNPHSGLLPDSPVAIARAVEWMNWLSTLLAGTISLNLHPYRFSDQKEAHPGIRAKGREAVADAFNLIDRRLAECDWALTEGYSIVDPVLLIFFKWGNLLKLDMSRFGNWFVHTERMLLRPAVQKTMATEKISLWDL